MNIVAIGFCGFACGWEAKDSFECVWCERRVCFCEGALDDTPALCNDCSDRLNHQEDPP